MLFSSTLSQNAQLKAKAADFSMLLRSHPVQGGLLYVVLSVSVTVSGVPFALIDLAAAWVYPFPVALLMLFTAKTVGSLLCFLVARTILPARQRQSVLSHPTIAKVNRLLAKGPVYYGSLCRLASMPAFVKNYGLASLSAINLPQYLCCCVIGSIIFVPVQAMLGSQLGGLYLGLVQQDDEKIAAAAVGACVGVVALLVAMRTIIPVLLREESDVDRLRGEIGESVCVCILGGTSFQCKDSEDLVKAIAKNLAKPCGMPNVPVSFITGGMAGVQKTFAEHCGDGSRIWNLLPVGESSGFAQGTDLHAGENLEKRKEVFGQLGDVYLTVEGGPGVAEEARAAYARGAVVVPLARTGGASSGMFDFPAKALEAPDFVDSNQWALLQDKTGTVVDSAAAAASIISQAAANAKRVSVGQKKAA